MWAHVGPPSSLHLCQRPGVTVFVPQVAYLGMTPLAKVVMLSADDKLDRQTLKMLLDSGHSRIPVYQGTR